MNDNKNTTSSGIGLCGLFTIVFITLKLCGVIHWSWLWVLAPTWISLVIAIVLVIIAFLW